MSLEIKILRAVDASVLDRVADGVFDGPVDDALRLEFLRDPRHHIAVAIDNGTVVGFASGVHQVHPDKPAELWINEVLTDEEIAAARALYQSAGGIETPHCHGFDPAATGFENLGVAGKRL
jgi:hypothetical protein